MEAKQTLPPERKGWVRAWVNAETQEEREELRYVEVQDSLGLGIKRIRGRDPEGKPLFQVLMECPEKFRKQRAVESNALADAFDTRREQRFLQGPVLLPLSWPNLAWRWEMRRWGRERSGRPRAVSIFLRLGWHRLRLEWVNPPWGFKALLVWISRLPRRVYWEWALERDRWVAKGDKQLMREFIETYGKEGF